MDDLEHSLDFEVEPDAAVQDDSCPVTEQLDSALLLPLAEQQHGASPAPARSEGSPAALPVTGLQVRVPVPAWEAAVGTQAAAGQQESQQRKRSARPVDQLLDVYEGQIAANAAAAAAEEAAAAVEEAAAKRARAEPQPPAYDDTEYRLLQPGPLSIQQVPFLLETVAGVLQGRRELVEHSQRCLDNKLQLTSDHLTSAELWERYASKALLRAALRLRAAAGMAPLHPSQLQLLDKKLTQQHRGEAKSQFCLQHGDNFSHTTVSCNSLFAVATEGRVQKLLVHLHVPGDGAVMPQQRNRLAAGRGGQGQPGRGGGGRHIMRPAMSAPPSPYGPPIGMYGQLPQQYGPPMGYGQPLQQYGPPLGYGQLPQPYGPHMGYGQPAQHQQYGQPAQQQQFGQPVQQQQFNAAAAAAAGYALPEAGGYMDQFSHPAAAAAATPRMDLPPLRAPLPPGLVGRLGVSTEPAGAAAVVRAAPQLAQVSSSAAGGAEQGMSESARNAAQWGMDMATSVALRFAAQQAESERKLRAEYAQQEAKLRHTARQWQQRAEQAHRDARSALQPDQEQRR